MSQPDEIEALTIALINDLRAVHEQILAEIQTLATDWFGLTPPRRLQRLRDLETQVNAMIDNVDVIAARQIMGITSTSYEIGAWTTAISGSTPALFTTVDVDAVTHLAADTFDGLLRATQGVREDVKALIRELARDRTRSALYTGKTATQAGTELAKQLLERGITAVIYRDGTRMPVHVYTEMVLRTKTAEAYQEGGFNQGDRLGFQYWEVFDGPGCGWAAHDDPQEANGMIVPTSAAKQYPIAHPNCRRATSPRPDIKSLKDYQTATPTSVTDLRAVQAAAVAAQKEASQRFAVSATPARSTARTDFLVGDVTPPTAS